MSSLTEEQKRRMEENRQKALAIRAQKMKSQTAVSNNISVTNNFQRKSFSHISKQNEILPKTNVQTSASKQSVSSTPSKQALNGSSAKSFSGKPLTGRFKLISKERFVVEFGFHSKVIEIFKDMSTKQYESISKKWSFHVEEHQKLKNALEPLRPEVCIACLPSSVLKSMEKYSKCSSTSNIDLTKLDPNLLEAFMPFQREGVCFGISREGRVLIADDMGLGKTIQALGIAAYYMEEWPLLVVTPSSVRYSWAAAVERWISSVDTDSINVVNTSKDSLEARVVIISYDILSRRAKELKDMNFKVVIMDESHMLKNLKTARSKAAGPIMKKAARVILLSGTPALSRPLELFPQLTGISPSLLPSFQEYGIRYCNGFKGYWGWDFSGYSNLEELQVLLESTVMIRRLKSTVMEQLPAKQRMTVILDPSAVKTSCKKLRKAARDFNDNHLKGGEKQGALLWFFSESAEAKLNAVSEYVRDLIDDGKKFLIFAHHQVMLNAICETCDEKKTSYIRIDGATKSEDRHQLVDHFQSNDNTKVAVLSITAASTGLTLTAAQLVVFAELYWNPGVLVQAEDRAHRIGQCDSVLVQYLIAKDTVDDHIWPIIQSKLNVLKKVGLSKVDFSSCETTNQRAVGYDVNQMEIPDYFPMLDTYEDFPAECFDEFFEDEPSSKKQKH